VDKERIEECKKTFGNNYFVIINFKLNFVAIKLIIYINIKTSKKKKKKKKKKKIYIYIYNREYNI